MDEVWIWGDDVISVAGKGWVDGKTDGAFHQNESPLDSRVFFFKGGAFLPPHDVEIAVCIHRNGLHCLQNISCTSFATFTCTRQL